MVASVALFQTLRAVSSGRILQLACQDHANFHTFFQVAWNFQDSGIFRQTVHVGYADSWLWGGHYTLTFLLASKLLQLHPTPGFLNALQLAAVCSSIPAGLLLGRNEGRHATGGLLGILAVVGCPPLLVVTLADYQDLVFCIPALLWATVFVRKGWLWAALIACGSLAACREECLLLVPLVGLTVPRSWSQRLLWAGATTLAGAAVLGLEVWFAGDMARYHSPITVVGPGSMQSLPHMVQLPGWLSHSLPTYWRALEPLGVLLLLSPLHLLGVLGISAFHLGDFYHATDWDSTLVHHFAPLVALVCAGVVIGGGRVLRWVLGLGRLGPPLAWLLIGSVLAGSAWRVAGWRVFRGAAWHAPITGKPSASITPHPAWLLASNLPADASVVADTRLVLAIADRRWAYDFTDSLESKTGGLGMRCVNFAIAARDHEEFIQAVQRVPRHELVRELDGYALFSVVPLVQPLPRACEGEGR